MPARCMVAGWHVDDEGPHGAAVRDEQSSTNTARVRGPHLDTPNNTTHRNQSLTRVKAGGGTEGERLRATERPRPRAKAGDGSGTVRATQAASGGGIRECQGPHLFLAGGAS